MAAPVETVPGRVTDYFIAALAACATVALLVHTADGGFTRDEAFYFGHAETYQEWLLRLQRGGDAADKALEHKEIVDTWQHNSEHPPLGKVLFGASWRLFGRKLRTAGNFRVEDGRVVADVQELGSTHGFGRAAKVTLLVPQVVGKPPDVAGREWLLGEVIRRGERSAVVRLAIAADLAKLQRRCLPPGPVAGVAKGAKPVVLRTSCEFVERRALYFLSESQAMRFPGMCFAGLLVACIYLAARFAFTGASTATSAFQPSRPVALAMAAGYLCLPQPFWHAHLATFDTTIAALLFLTTLAYHRSLRAPVWVWPTAALWGVSLLAKHNALFLPVPLVAHWLWDAAAEGRISWTRAGLRGWRGPVLAAVVALAVALAWRFVHPVAAVALALWVAADRRVRLHLPPLPTALFAMLPVGLVILVAGWPLLWHDPADRVLRWIEFHLHHEHYMQSYFGRVLGYPPFPVEFAWAMSAFTWPLTLLATFFVGLLVVCMPRHWPAWLIRRQQVPAASAVTPQALPAPSAHLPGHRRRKKSSHYLTAWTRMDAHDATGRTAELRSFDRMVLLSLLWPIALISLPGTPVFGGTKHWMLAYPFMLLVAARGVHWLIETVRATIAPAVLLDPAFNPIGTEASLAQLGVVKTQGPRDAGWLRRRLLPALVGVAVLACVLGPAAQAAVDVHPHGSAYYNELVGGVSGAADRQMQRQFWGGTTRDGLETVNARAAQGASVWFHKCAWGAYAMYGREGWLRRDLRHSGGPGGTDIGFYHHQRDHDDYELEMMRDYGTRTPVWQAARDGVLLLSVYERPSR
jgi:hypothetical protein